MNKTQEALKMAIEALESLEPDWECPHGYHHNQCPHGSCDCVENKYWKALNACKEALEQPTILDKAVSEIDAEIERNGGAWVEQQEQEPVAWIKQGMDGYPKLVFNGKFEYESISAKWDDIALYTKEQI